MNKLYCLWKRLTGGVFTFPIGRCYAKLFMPFAYKKMTSELEGNAIASKDAVWRDYCVLVRPIGRSLLCMARGVEADPVRCEDLVLALARRSMQEGHLTRSSQLVDLEVFKLALLESNELECISNFLFGLYLPAGSSHGDLHHGNFIEINGSLKIIDWSMCRSNSSPVFDYLHYHCRSLCKNNALSWTDAIWLDIPAWMSFGVKYGFSVDRLRIAYAVDRVAREVAQKNDIDAIHNAKYQKVIRKLLAACQGPCIKS